MLKKIWVKKCSEIYKILHSHGEIEILIQNPMKEKTDITYYLPSKESLYVTFIRDNQYSIMPEFLMVIMLN